MKDFLFSRTGQPVWELAWSPYDETTYEQVLAEIGADDFVLEIGSGDLRLARRLAAIARRVEAVEINRWLVDLCRKSEIPENLVLHHADALRFPFPDGITVAVLLMRHCTHYREYVTKLRRAGCKRLITNARWHLGVEVVQLNGVRSPYQGFDLGWYACECGAVGFKPGEPNKINQETEQLIFEVSDCPACSFQLID